MSEGYRVYPRIQFYLLYLDGELKPCEIVDAKSPAEAIAIYSAKLGKTLEICNDSDADCPHVLKKYEKDFGEQLKRFNVDEHYVAEFPVREHEDSHP